MTIEERVNAEIKTAMLARQSARLEALRAIKAVVLYLKTSPEGYSEQTAQVALQKEVKKRNESAGIYTQQNRQDLADIELAQALVISEFLPKPLTEEEIRIELQQIINETGIKQASELGKVMGIASKKLAGKADNRKISELLKSLLTP
jgi:uncharacterized protein YqeY